MLNSLRTRFGIPGVISIIALVFAMLGGAYAATSSGKRHHKKAAGTVVLAKKFSKKFSKAYSRAFSKRFAVPGPAGPQGPAGAQGPKGDTGAAGSNGTDGADGADGADGKSVAVTAIPVEEPECAELGGAIVEVDGAGSGVEVCNGENGEKGEKGDKGDKGDEGSPWVVGAAPSGALMKGTFALSVNAAGAGEKLRTAISTTVPLGGGIGLVLKDGEEFGPVECPSSGTAANPEPAVFISDGEPASQVLCIYAAEEANVESGYLEGKLVTSTGGAVLEYKSEATGLANVYGSWAMYAP